MKLTTKTKRLSLMSLLLAVAIISGTQNVRAQDDDLLDDTDELLGNDSLQMDDISIEGKLSPSELLKRRREKLEERNKIMVEKKIEDIRVKQEIALTNKLQGAFNNSLNNLNEDKVQTVQAAPVAPAPVAPAPIIETRIIEVPAPAPVVERKASKIIPAIGTSSVKSDRIDLGSNLNIGVALETNVLPQVSVGFGIGYTTFDITDVANDFSNNGGINNGGYYNPGYYNVYGAGRKMTNKKLTIEAGGKFFFTEDSRLKPYLGAAISFNRSTLKYENTNSYSTGGVNFGDEGYSSTAMAGTARLGAEIDLNETVGFNIDLAYTKNITSGISKNANTLNTNPDQFRLENVTKEIEEGDTTSIQAGVVIRF
jgi:hypothetical protein